MGTTPEGQGQPGWQRALAAVGYLLLFLLGALEGMIGSFQYSQPPEPVIAIVLAVVIFATCVACGWGVGTFTGGLLPAAGWIIASFILAMPRSNGSVIVTATAAGEWYLYGGAIGCLAGSLASFLARVRLPPLPR